ncbi:MAG: MOSC domain-containing protein, partial [Candidatus Poribacteria bacterium]|nr:MOSC domain-containing protein [Candidatus Poribacteria bacterium]
MGRRSIRARNNRRFSDTGENLTVEGMQEDTVHIGDVFRVGDGLVEVSQPRVPCAKLGMKMGTPEFIAPFLK